MPTSQRTGADLERKLHQSVAVELTNPLACATKMQEYGLALRASVLGHSGEIRDADYANKITFSNATAAHVNRLKVELGHVAQ